MTSPKDGNLKHKEPQSDAGGASPERPRRLIFSPLTRRILAINILALAIPVGGLLYLGPYRDGLIETELEALRTQTDIFAGALGEGAIQTEPSGRKLLNVNHARDMIRRLTAAASVRARLFLNSGEIIADSRHLGDRGRLVRVLSLPPPEDVTTIEHFAGMIDWLLERMHARTDLETYREAQQQTISDYPETRLALAGEVTGVARHDGSGVVPVVPGARPELVPHDPARSTPHGGHSGALQPRGPAPLVLALRPLPQLVRARLLADPVAAVG